MGIFINYRRQDSEDITGRIDDHLTKAFGRGEVFRDINSIPPGDNFVRHLQAQLAKCDVCVAVIGRGWVSPRLGDEGDYVRRELEAALDRGIPIIPVLVGRVEMPKPEGIPKALHALCETHALRVDSDDNFPAQIDRLISTIRKERRLIKKAIRILRQNWPWRSTVDG